MVGYSISVEKESRLGRSLFSATDIPVLEYSHSRATIFGLNWSTYFILKGIEPKDIWTSDSVVHSLMNARLFPLALDANSWSDLLWLQDIKESTDSRLESWRQSKRYSIDDFHRLSDPVAALHNLRWLNSSVILQSISHWPGALAPYFRRACSGKLQQPSCVILQYLPKYLKKICLYNILYTLFKMSTRVRIHRKIR